MMKNIIINLFTLVLLCGLWSQINGQSLTAKPLSSVVSQSAGVVKTSGGIKVPMITWGGDVATIYAKDANIFSQEGLNISLFKEDNFKKQVERCLSGETPYLRGTMGMINAASEVFKQKGKDLVVIYQLTWSTGGDAMVVRNGKNLKSVQSIALQLYGPHMDYAANLMSQTGKLSSTKFKWYPELTLPTYNTGGKVLDPVSAFQADAGIDAVMCIIPDALMLTSNGNVGTGSEGSVKGASILLSTKTAGRIIADVYAVRKDYFESNKSEVKKFVKALMVAEERLRELKKNKNSTEYRNLMSKSAMIFFGASEASADAEALLGDCEFVGFTGNKSFFTGAGTLRNFETLNSEIQSSFKKIGIMSQSVSLQKASWNYSEFASDMRNTTASSAKKFDQQKAASMVEERINVEPTAWEEEGTLFVVEINFSPNQSDFPLDQYKGDFQKALQISQTYSGALIVIEGHSDPLGILKAQKDGVSKQEVSAQKQKAKNLSLQRSQNVRTNFIKYAKGRGIGIDESQFLAVGLGIQTPKYNPPRTKEEWAANRRVVFRIKQIEAELDEFIPLD